MGSQQAKQISSACFQASSSAACCDPNPLGGHFYSGVANMPKYFKFPYELAATKELTAPDKIALALIADLCQKTGYCWASNRSLAKLLGRDVSTVKRTLRELRRQQLIEIYTVREGNRVVSRRIHMGAKARLTQGQKRAIDHTIDHTRSKLDNLYPLPSSPETGERLLDGLSELLKNTQFDDSEAH